MISALLRGVQSLLTTLKLKRKSGDFDHLSYASGMPGDKSDKALQKVGIVVLIVIVAAIVYVCFVIGNDSDHTKYDYTEDIVDTIEEETAVCLGWTYKVPANSKQKSKRDNNTIFYRYENFLFAVFGESDKTLNLSDKNTLKEVVSANIKKNCKALKSKEIIVNGRNAHAVELSFREGDAEKAVRAVFISNGNDYMGLACIFYPEHEAAAADRFEDLLLSVREE